MLALGSPCRARQGIFDREDDGNATAAIVDFLVNASLLQWKSLVFLDTTDGAR